MADEIDKEQALKIIHKALGTAVEKMGNDLLAYVNGEQSNLEKNIENFDNMLFDNAELLKAERNFFIEYDIKEAIKNIDLSYYDRLQVVFLFHELVKPANKDIDKKDFFKSVKVNPSENEKDNRYSKIMLDAKEFLVAMDTVLASDRYKDIAFLEILEQSIDRSKDKSGILIAGSILDKIFKEAEEIFKTTIQADLVENEIERIKHFPIQEIKTPVDKTNKLFFGINTPRPKKDINGQLEFLPVSVGNDSKQINVYYSYFLDNELLERLGIANKIWQKDFTICSVINGFRESGNNIITFSQLHKALGNRTRPNSTQLQKLQDNCTKLLSTTIMLDTKELAAAYNLENYNEFIGSLLPIAIVNEKAYINGQLVEGYIKILDEPPLITLAKKTNQITSISPKLLEVDIKHNDMFYAIFNYLVREISHIKNPGYIRRNKILYSSIYAELGIEGTTEKERKARDRAKTTIYKILKHFKENDYITDYKEETTASTGEIGVTISFSK